MKIVKLNEKNIKKSVEFLKSGKSVVYPTDTAYGLAVNAADGKAVKNLYRIKGRDFKKPVHVVVNSINQAKKFVQFNPLAEKLFKKFLPGALTLVLEVKSGITNLESWMILSAGTQTLGIRMPKNQTARALVKGLGRPITATSANVSKKPACYSVAEVTEQFKHRRIRPDLILDAGQLPKIRPSTIVAFTSQSVKILRQGPISKKRILTVCAERR